MKNKETMSKLEIIHLDDDLDARSEFEEFIKSEGSEIALTSLASETDFFSWIKEQEPRSAVFFIDLRMEAYDSGFKCISFLRNSNWANLSTIAVLSNSNTSDDKQKAHSLGADFFITKGPVRTVSDSISGLLELFEDGAFLLRSGSNESLHDSTDLSIGNRQRTAETFVNIGITVSLITLSLTALIAQHREVVRGDNSLSVERRELALGNLEKLQSVVEEAKTLDNLDFVKDDASRLSWLSRFKKVLAENVRDTIEPDSVAKATVPTSIILTCTALGSVIAGPMGFGVGAVFGNLLAKQVKPSAAAKEISKTFEQQRPSEELSSDLNEAYDK